jgi:hypothetical protein
MRGWVLADSCWIRGFGGHDTSLRIRFLVEVCAQPFTRRDLLSPEIVSYIQYTMRRCRCVVYKTHKFCSGSHSTFLCRSLGGIISSNSITNHVATGICSPGHPNKGMPLTDGGLTAPSTTGTRACLYVTGGMPLPSLWFRGEMRIGMPSGAPETGPR